ncbi:hypothetical protein GCM10010172_31080 [Paractinoplanes ferrugineus]|uniref:Uncharacterized protein n=1 Tax=Paractinoplanes ferrugineus TaxID=113564 RepID=A0A919J486_9ACTN|nr:hypothetical protein [Actinoplanes ferrugineus]GIE14200.1 hypothetical protein Afe05nite_60400 [Actinoplanes ferrugineus]
MHWIANVRGPSPLVSGWAQYAAAASQRMRPSGDLLVQRAALADAAIRAGILPSADGSCRTAAAAAALIADTGRAPADQEYVLDGLHAYASVHERGFCAVAHSGLRHMRMPAESHDGPRFTLLATLVVSVALLSACGRDDLCATMLDVHAAQLEPAGTCGRELFATLALDLTDWIRESHRGVCTHARKEPSDRHRFSALLHGEPPARHHSPLAAGSRAASVPAAGAHPAAPAEGAPSLSLDGVLYGLSAHAQTLRHRQLLHARPTSSNVWLVCDTCRIALRLGASVVRTDLPDTLSVPIITAGRPAWQHRTVSRAMWRLLSDHCGHELRVLTQVSPAWRKYAVTPTDLISQPGTDPAPEITLDAYLTGWPGQSSITHFGGARPAPAEQPVDGEVSLVCLTCRLDVVLGRVSASPGAAITIGRQLAADHPTATTAVIRMLTEHTGHDLMIFTDNSPWDFYTEAGDWGTTVETDNDNWPPLIGNITHRQYVDGWPEAPTRRYYRGSDPLDASHAPAPPPGPAS